MKKLTIFFLVLALISSTAAMVSAAEADFRYDILASEFSIRGEQGPVLAEIPFAEKKWKKSLSEPVWGLSGFNVGVKGPELSPFYAKLQFNWLRSTNIKKGKETEYNFDGVEVGIGGVYDLWNYTSFGAEVSLQNPSLKQIDTDNWSVEVFLKYNFDDFLGLEPNKT